MHFAIEARDKEVRMTMKRRAKQEAFILDWIAKHGKADACDQAFHDAFYAKFGGARPAYTFGAMPVQKAQRLLASLEKQGVLNRWIIRLEAPEPGFPKWVYAYTKGSD